MVLYQCHLAHSIEDEIKEGEESRLRVMCVWGGGGGDGDRGG